MKILPLESFGVSWLISLKVVPTSGYTGFAFLLSTLEGIFEPTVDMDAEIHSMWYSLRVGFLDRAFRFLQ